MKAAPVIASLSAHAGVSQVLVHTGQHYDANMSEVFFRQLGLPEPDANLGIGSGSQAQQTARVMIAMEDCLQTHHPDLIVVYGDVNSTVAAALAAAKLGIPVAHVEAGLRSFDRAMPEELNRLVTDQLSDVLLTPSADADENLLREGIKPERIHRVGNVMIDTLVRLLPQASPPEGLQLAQSYALVTLHRPSNVDDPRNLQKLVAALCELSSILQVVFPVHPRTRQRMQSLSLEMPKPGSLFLIEPLGYLGFLALQRDAAVVITDSGGVQEETTFLGVPCLTVRNNTERPVTVSMGTNTLVGNDAQRLLEEARRIVAGQAKRGTIPPLWDGHAAERVAKALTGRDQI
jgi:UDP-N-acetylglucosamine 2-epimerase (non-hydrolysing)